MKSQDTESKAFSKSINKTSPGASFSSASYIKSKSSRVHSAMFRPEIKTLLGVMYNMVENGFYSVCDAG